MSRGPLPGVFPSQSYIAWESACATIGTLISLRCLAIDLTIRHRDDLRSDSTMRIVEPEAYVCILGPLKAIEVADYNVEIHPELPDAARQMLEPFNFRIMHRHRPYDTQCFPQL
jgi:hypothetical protein